MPVPAGPWIMYQSWRDLLFAHWPLPAEELRDLVPRELEIDRFEDSAWVGLTPFRVTDLRVRFLPPLPGMRGFPEMNFRTYVRRGDRPGVLFFSLDADHRLAVTGARIAFRLPYFPARIRTSIVDGWVHYRSSRGPDRQAEFVGRYRPFGPVFFPPPGTLEHFLIERYALYAVLADGVLLRGDIHHGRWAIRGAEAVIERNTIASAHGISLPRSDPLLHFSSRQDTRIWLPKPIAAA